MTIKVIEQEKEWEQVRLRLGQSGFGQAWFWGEILKSEGKQVERLGVEGNGQIVGLAQVVYENLFFGLKYAICVQGPTGEFLEQKILAEYFKQKKCVFFRLEPPVTSVTAKPNLVKTIDITPCATLILDLKNTEAGILASLEQKTRYNLRLAQKKNLQVVWGKNYDIFLKLSQATAARDQFGLHRANHYRAVLGSDAVEQVTIYSGDIPVAVAVFVRDGSVYTYLYGASDYHYRDLMAPYLAQWQGITRARNLGCLSYDFFGVAPTTVPGGSYNFDRSHQYAGVSNFKKGWAGSYREYVGTYDLIFANGLYLMYKWLRRIRRLV